MSLDARVCSQPPVTLFLNRSGGTAPGRFTFSQSGHPRTSVSCQAFDLEADGVERHPPVVVVQSDYALADCDVQVSRCARFTGFAASNWPARHYERRMTTEARKTPVKSEKPSTCSSVSHRRNGGARPPCSRRLAGLRMAASLDAQRSIPGVGVR